MGVPVYKRILELFEAEGINTLFGIPDPNFVHMFVEAEKRGWTVVAPHHEERRLHGGGRLAHDRQARPVHRHAGPGYRQHRRGHEVREGRKFAGHLPRRPARPHHRAAGAPRPHPVRQAGMPVRAFGEVHRSIEYADQTDEIIREAIRRAMSGTPGPSYIEYPSTSSWKSSMCRSRCRRAAIAWSTRAQTREVAEAAKLIREAKNPILLVGHGVHTSRTQGAGQGTGRADELPGDPDLGRHLLHPGPRGPHLRLRLLAVGRRGGRASRTCASRSAPNSASRCTTAGPGTGRSAMTSANGSTSSRIRSRSA